MPVVSTSRIAGRGARLTGVLTLLGRCLALGASLALSGCVTPVPVGEQAIKPTYVGTRPIIVSVVDSRPELKEGKPPNFIGRMHLAFGIPADMLVYPIISEDKTDKQQSLAAALEKRIVQGFSTQGWQAQAAGLQAAPDADQRTQLFAAGPADRLLVITLTRWFASINTNWVTGFNFDWGVRMQVYDRQGSVLADYTDEGRDVIDAQYDQSYGNMLRLAYKDRLTKILEDTRVRTALASGGAGAGNP